MGGRSPADVDGVGMIGRGLGAEKEKGTEKAGTVSGAKAEGAKGVAIGFSTVNEKAAKGLAAAGGVLAPLLEEDDAKLNGVGAAAAGAAVVPKLNPANGACRITSSVDVMQHRFDYTHRCCSSRSRWCKPCKRRGRCRLRRSCCLAVWHPTDPRTHDECQRWLVHSIQCTHFLPASTSGCACFIGPPSFCCANPPRSVLLLSLIVPGRSSASFRISLRTSSSSSSSLASGFLQTSQRESSSLKGV